MGAAISSAECEAAPVPATQSSPSAQNSPLAAIKVSAALELMRMIPYKTQQIELAADARQLYGLAGLLTQGRALD